MYPIVSKAVIDYDSIEDILEFRTKVLSRFNSLKNAAHIKGAKLAEVKKLRYFIREIEEFMLLLNELFDAVPEEHLEDLTNLQAKVCKHEDIDSELKAREDERDVLEQIGLQMIAENHSDSEIIRKKIYEMKDKWQSLSSKLTDQIEILRTKQHFIEFERNYDKFVQWMKEKVNFVSEIQHYTSLEEIEQYIYEFTQMEKKVFRMEVEVEDLRATADFFIKDDYPQSYNVSQKKENLNYCWKTLKGLIQEKKIEVSELIRLHKLCCRVEEFISWIERKRNLSSNDDDDFGADLSALLSLQGKNDGMVRILEQLELRFEDIIHEHDCLNALHSELTTGILIDKIVIQQNWLDLKTRVKERRRNLRERYKIYQLKADIDDMVSWMNELKSILSSEDISGKVADGEATLSMLNIYKNVMNSRRELIDEIFQTGGELLLVCCKHFAEINGKISELYRAKQSLQELYECQENKYKVRMELQILNRDYDLAENWLTQKESFLHIEDDRLNSLDAIQELVDQQNEFEATFESELKRMEFLVDGNLKNTENADQKDQRKAQMLESLASFRCKLRKRFQLLEDAFKLQLFYSDCDDVERWIIEKLRILNNGNYLDESRISAIIASNALFANELSNYCNVIDKIKAREQEMIEEKHYAFEVVQKRVKALLDSWLPLVLKADEIASKSVEILDARCFLQITSKLDLNITEYTERLDHLSLEGEISTKIKVGKNLDSLLHEARVFERSVHNMKTIGLQLIQKSHYDSENISKKIETLSKRYTTLISKFEEKRKIITDACEASELFMDIEEQIKWMEKQTLSLSVIKTDHGLLDVQRLVVKYKINTATMNARESEIVKLKDRAQKMISDNHPESSEIRKISIKLLDSWSELTIQNNKLVQKLEEAKKIYDYFAEAELNESLMQEKKLILNSTNYGRNEDSSSALLKRHQVIIEDLKAYGKIIDNLRIKAEECKVKSEPVESCPVSKRQDGLNMLYEDLMKLAEDRKNKLENTHRAYALIRETAELVLWIAVKKNYAEETNIGENITEVEILQKHFDDFQADLAERKIKLIGILTKSEKLHPLLQDELAEMLLHGTEEVKTQMKNLQEVTKNRQTQLNSAHELQRFYRDVDDTEYWIREKNTNLDCVDCGDSLKKIRTLLRKHEGVERDLDALEESIENLNEAASRLIIKYPDSADKLESKQKEINEKWKKLYEKAIYRKQNLLDSYDLQKFFSDHEHLMSWIDKMTTVLNSIERTSDFHSAEILKENFQGFAIEIEAYLVRVQTINKFGEILINSNKTVANEIRKKLEELKLGYELLEKGKLSKKILIDQNLEVNIFFKACKNVEIWLASQNALLTTGRDSEELAKIHKRMDQSITMKQNEIKSLQDWVNNLITHCHEDKERIVERCDEILMEWQKLKDTHIKMRSELKESQTLQQFLLEAAEVEYWIDNRLLHATQENYRDPVNIKSKLLKHQAFEAEISSNTRLIQKMLENGNRLIESEQSENLKLAVQERLKYISNQWTILMEKTSEKSEKLKEVSKQYDHIIAIKYMNFWMGDVETTLLNQDIGRDLNAVQNLLGQHKVIQEDIEAHWEKIKNLENEAEIFTGDSIFDIVSIKDEHINMIARYEKIKNLAAQRTSRLNDKNRAFLLFKEIADKEAWMREVASSIENVNQIKFKCDRAHSAYLH